eukprot:1561337-Prymnesium_polylepis.1
MKGGGEPPAFTSSGGSREPMTCEKPTQRHLASLVTNSSETAPESKRSRGDPSAPPFGFAFWPGFPVAA